MTDNILISYDPSNGEIIGQVERTRIEDIPEKVQVARKAQKLWAELTVDERISYLEKCAESLSNKADEITQLLSREMGKDLKRASNEVQSCIQDVPFKTREIKEAIKTKVMKMTV